MKEVVDSLNPDTCRSLCIKADAIDDFGNNITLEKMRGVIEFYSIGKKEILLFIDQIDALSQCMSNDRGHLNVMMTLLSSLENWSNVRAIVSCRNYDLNYDSDLCNLKNKAHLIEIGNLTDDEVAGALEKYGYKGLFFISTKYIGATNFLSEEEIRNLSNRGHVIGSHAHSHRHMYTLEKKDIETEWRESITILERILDKPIYYASIPNGDKSKSVLEYAHKYGIRNIYTSDPTTEIKDFYDMKIIGRYVVLSNDTTDTVLSIISNSSVRFILSSKHLILGVIKKLLGSNYVKLKNYIFR